MFMVTAYGTAVRIEQKKAQSISTYRSSISSEDIDKRILEMEFLDSASSKTLQQIMDSNDIYKYKSNDFVRLIIRRLNECKDDMIDKPFIKKICEYLSIYRSDVVRKAIQEFVLEGNYSSDFISNLIAFPKYLKVGDLAFSLEILESDKHKSIGVPLAKLDQEDFNADDIPLLRRIIDILDERFPIVELTETKSWGMVEKVWVCACGNQSRESVNCCQKCGLSRRQIAGVSEEHFSMTRSGLAKKLVALEREFQQGD